MKEKRLYGISILRVLAMLMVVYYHCICPYYIWPGVDSAGVTVPLYTKLSLGLNMVHLPIFFIVAGYLFGYKRLRGGYADQRQFLLDKTLRVLVPYFTVGLVLIALRQANPGGLVAGYCGHLWFLVTIFECYAVGKLIDFVLWERRKTQAAAFLIATICYGLSYFVDFVLGGRFPHYFFFYFGGMLIATVDLDRLRKWRMLFAAVAVMSLVAMVLEAMLCDRRLLSHPCSVALVFSSLLVFRTLRIGDVPRWLKSLDACSMGIYIVHHIVIQTVNRTDLLHPVLQTHYNVYPTIQFVLVLLFSWAFVWALRRYPIARYFGL